MPGRDLQLPGYRHGNRSLVEFLKFSPFNVDPRGSRTILLGLLNVVLHALKTSQMFVKILGSLTKLTEIIINSLSKLF